MKVVLAMLICIVMKGCSNKPMDEFEKAVTIAVERQMTQYPKSTMKDLYKNFFQDKFGPGHLVADTAAAGNYIRRELASFEYSDGELYEPTGWEGNFYRLNLSVLKDGTISYDVFFDAFVRSVNSIVPITIEEWIEEWSAIEALIDRMALNLPDYEADKAEIHERLKSGDYVGHHSKQFEEAYSPHYRIINKQILNEELMKYLK